MSLLDYEPKILDDVKLKSRGKSTIVEEIKGFLRVFKDGYVDRSSPHVQNVPPSPQSNPSCVISRDELIDVQTGIWARIYVQDEIIKSPKLLPIVVYFHGGGFCMGSASWSIYDAFLTRLAMEANCMIISVNYRLAPEHRLPAQYEDGIKALQWLQKNSAQKKISHEYDANEMLSSNWVSLCGDFQKCFLAGDSAGANIVHNLTMTKGNCSDKMVSIEGYILIQPFFGGIDVFRWEEENSDPALPHNWIDIYWKLALPLGANRNHPFCNPLLALRNIHEVQKNDLPSMLLCVGEEDVLRERNMEYYNALVEAGIDVRNVVFKGVGHAFHVLRPHSPRVPELIKLLSQFINTRKNSS